MIKRKSIIIYFRSPKALRQIEKITPINYYTKKRKYAISYVNETEVEEITKQLSNIKLVRRIEESLFETEGYEIEDMLSKNA